MSDDERFALVERMRAAQMLYFTTRSSIALNDSLRLENAVDAMLEQRRKGPGLVDDVAQK